MVRIGARAKFDSFALVAGIGLVRRQMFVRFEGAESETSLSGVSLLGGREHADTTLRVEHVSPGCMSRETFKYILDEEATGVFQGKIHVAPGAQDRWQDALQGNAVVRYGRDEQQAGA
jgi:Fe-S cluster assembly protein SufD